MKNIKIFTKFSAILMILSFFISANAFAQVPAPELLSPANGQTGVLLTPELDWSDVVTAESYSVQITNDAMFNSILLDTIAFSSSVTLPASILGNNTTYYWRVASADIEGIYGEWSVVSNFSTYSLPTVGANLPSNFFQGGDWQTFSASLINPADGIDYQGVAFPFEFSAGTDLNVGDLALEYFDGKSWINIEVTENSGNLTGVFGPQGMPLGIDQSMEIQIRMRAGVDAPISSYDLSASLVDLFTKPTQTIASLNESFEVLIAIPSTPELVSPEDGAIDQNLAVTFDWNDAANAESYHLQVSADSSFSTVIVDEFNLIESNYSIDSTLLINNTEYYWRVRSINTSGTYGFSEAFSFTTVGVIAEIPSVPVLLSPENGSIDQSLDVTFDWSDADNADTYQLQISNDPTFKTITFDVSNLTSSTYSIDTAALKNNNEYFWRVRATNVTGSSEYSEMFSFTTIAIIAEIPSVPVLLSPENGVIDQNLAVIFDWSDAANAESYQLQISMDSSFAKPVVDLSGIVLSTYEIDSTLLNNSTGYYWRVRATNVTGSSEYAEMFSFTTAAAPTVMPSIPELVSPSNGLTGVSATPTFVWNAAQNADNYELQISKDTLFATPIVEEIGIKATEFTVQSGILANGNWFYWRLRSVNINGSSEYSEVFSFRTISAVPMIPVLLTPEHGSINVSAVSDFDWEDVNGAEAYKIQVAGDSLFTNIVIDEDSLSNSIYRNESNPLMESTTYYWRVIASNKGGEGEYSSVFMFTVDASLPPAPLLVSPVDGAKDVPVTPTLDWNDFISEELESVYEVEVALDDQFEEMIISKTGVSTSEYTVETALASQTPHYWRVRLFTDNGTSEWSETWSFTTTTLTGLNNISGQIPSKFEMDQNYPNPFNPSTKIRFGIPHTTAGIQTASVMVYNMLGQLVATLFNGQLTAGIYEVQFDAAKLSSGTYFYELRTGDFRSIKRMTLIK